MLIHADVLDLLDLETAVDLEAADPPDMLPRSEVDGICGVRAEDFSRWLRGNLGKDWHLATPEVVAARKPNGSSRPVPLITFQDRVLYRALSRALTPDASLGAARGALYDAMASGPMQEGDWPFIVHADVAAFYQYVDHDLLAAQLIARTGESGVATALGELLFLIMGRGFGLPQTYHASEPLADAYIEPCESSLIRAGLPTWRYSDDFRMAEYTPRAAEAAIQRLDLELGKLGLTLNDDKTFVLPRARYETWLTKAEQEFEALAEQAEVDLAFWNPYSEEEIAPEQAEVLAAAAVSALELWRDRVDGPDHKRLAGSEGLATRKLLGLALDVLKIVGGEASAVSLAGHVLREEPQLTPRVARYYSIAVDTSSAEVHEVVESLLDDDTVYLSAWQRIWLLVVLHDSAGSTARLNSWITAEVNSGDGLLTAHAARTASKHGLLSVDELLSLISQLPRGSSAPVLEALRARRHELTKPQLKAVRNLGWIEDAYLSHDGPPR